MHAKLLLALVVIALHHVIGARAKRPAGLSAGHSADPAAASSAGSVQAAGGAGILTVVLAVAALGRCLLRDFKIPM